MSEKPVGCEDELENEVNETTKQMTVKKDSSVVAFDKNSFADAAYENLGGESLRLSDLDRIKIPSGGGKSFIVSSDGKEDDVKEIFGTIVMSKPARVYWEKSYEEAGGGNPPDCSSDDCITGVGSPGGECLKCVLGQFTKDSEGKKQKPRCAEKRMVFLKEEESLFPSLFIVPPSALKTFRSYLVGLSKKGIKLNNIVTKITLKSEKTPSGIAYSVPVFEIAGEVKNKEAMEAYCTAIRPVLESFSVTDAIAEETIYDEAA